MFTETIELSGHIIDNQVLPRVLDQIVSLGADYRIDKIEIGHTRNDVSRAIVTVSAKSDAALQSVIELIARSGASLLSKIDAALESAPRDGVLPDDFYATTNLPTEILLGGHWIRSENAEMDCALVVDERKKRVNCVRMHRVKKGQRIVTGHAGVRVETPSRAVGAESAEKEAFGFMGSAVSSEKPKHRVIREIARTIRAAKKRREKILFVGGPAIVHTGAGPHLEKIIRDGFVDVLFAGNALAAHDIESALFGTSLGVSLQSGTPVEHGHEHHLRAINRIRAAGSIAQAVKKGIIPAGIMRACVLKKIPFVLSGSIRDDGPLPDVITDMPKAQDAMRALLPADRGTFQAIGLVTDAELFLRTLAKELSR